MSPWNFHRQVTIWWAGLMRGAVSMALAYNQVKNIEYSVTESRLKISFLDMTITVIH